MGAGELARAPMKSCFRLFKLFSLQRDSVKNRDAPAQKRQLTFTAKTVFDIILRLKETR